MPWCRQADASFLCASYRFASANSENTCAPFLARPAIAHLAIAEVAFNDTKHMLHFRTHLPELACTRFG